MDKSGLWANFSHLEGDAWINDDCDALWGTDTTGLTKTSANMVENFGSLRFGAPCITCLGDGTVFVAFWCTEDYVSNIRWFKLRVD